MGSEILLYGLVNSDVALMLNSSCIYNTIRDAILTCAQRLTFVLLHYHRLLSKRRGATYRLPRCCSFDLTSGD